MKSKAVIEIPEGSFDKIEIKDGIARVDRKLTIPMPLAYGFIPDTLAEDEDPLDIFILSKNSLKTGQQVQVNIIGVFNCLDQGVKDDKILAILGNNKFDESTIFKVLIQVGDFLLNYKEGFVVLGYKNYNPDIYFWKKLKRDLEK